VKLLFHDYEELISNPHVPPAKSVHVKAYGRVCKRKQSPSDFFFVKGARKRNWKASRFAFDVESSDQHS